MDQDKPVHLKASFLSDLESFGIQLVQRYHHYDFLDNDIMPHMGELTKREQYRMQGGICFPLCLLWARHYPTWSDFITHIEKLSSVQQIISLQMMTNFNLPSDITSTDTPGKKYFPQADIFLSKEVILEKKFYKKRFKHPENRIDEISGTIIAQEKGVHIIKFRPSYESGHVIALFLDQNMHLLRGFNPNLGLFSFSIITPEAISYWIRKMAFEASAMTDLEYISTQMTLRPDYEEAISRNPQDFDT